MFLINFNQWKCACVGINNLVTGQVRLHVQLMDTYSAEFTMLSAFQALNILNNKQIMNHQK